MDAVPVKRALCVNTNEVAELTELNLNTDNIYTTPLPTGFYDLDAFMVDRAVCETDESTLQLLPYIVLIDKALGKVFMYQRGKAGEESRLHALYSIGVGGHIDHEPMGGNMFGLFCVEAAREVYEEVGYQLVQPPKFERLLLDRSNPVGRVHLGIVAFYPVDSTTVSLTLEHGTIDGGKFVDLSLFEDETEVAKLEPWSRMVIQYMQMMAFDE